MNIQDGDLMSILTGFGSKSMEKIGFFPFLSVMAISLLSAFFIALLYSRFYQERSTGSRIYRVFPLLGISITAIFITIQFSLPLSLGLLGALSIVRFRTPIKEPEEIGFIMLVVASSLCCATFNMLFLAVILSISIVGLLLQRYSNTIFDIRLNDGVLIVSVPTELIAQVEEKVLGVMQNNIKTGRVDSIASDGIESTITYNFAENNQPAIIDVQNQIKSLHEQIKVSVFFNNVNVG